MRSTSASRRTPPHISRYFSIRNFFFPDTPSVHTYPVNPAYEPATFWMRSPGWTLDPDICLSGDVTRSSPVLYREYCIKDGHLDAYSVANIPRGVLVLEWIRIRVGPGLCKWAAKMASRFWKCYLWRWQGTFKTEAVENLKTQKSTISYRKKDSNDFCRKIQKIVNCNL